jgi:hypothetical protein
MNAGSEPVFLNVYGAQESIPRNDTIRYDNPIPTRFLAPIDCLKIPALARAIYCKVYDLRSGGLSITFAIFPLLTLTVARS